MANIGDRGDGFAIEQHVERRDLISHRRPPQADMQGGLARLHR